MPKWFARTRGLALANIAVLFFGLAGVLGKLSALPSPIITLTRVVFAGLVLIIVALFQRTPLRPASRRDGWILCAQGALLALHWTSFFQSINVSSVAIGLLSFSSFPLLTALLEPLILQQRPTRIQIFAALLVLPGIYLLVPSFSVQNNTTLGVLWGLLAGATFALLSVTNRWLGRSYPSLTISLYQDSVAALVLLPTLFLIPVTLSWTPRELLILLILGICCTALAHTLFISSMRTITAQAASLLANLEPVWGILFGIALLHEFPAPSTWLGGAIILFATLLPAFFGLLRQRREQQPSHNPQTIDKPSNLKNL
ncbi:EamA family transporter [Ktedonosporobacter rubrisoli]|uniref:EamA family transporter n=1 Tax=Ktedonosporobacter rubrisoli TaxID=2509675 RepID=A0A4V0YY29_KTERU|nr:EamA family transporter [Ktedonosporobacter rubrisoli]QBD74781.1 EamA family transporter [Ktedonosporobacter rubrisoli]